MYREDLAQAAAFFGTVYKPGHIMTDPQHIAWQFLDHPHADGKRTSLFLVDEEKIVGFLGIIPQHTHMDGRIVDVGWCANLVVAPELRGHAGGGLLLKEAQKEWEALATTGYNAQSEPVLTALGWNMQPALNRWVRQELHDSGENPMPIDRFTAVWDATWERIRSRYPATTNRDHAFLNWRYVDHPRNEYVVLTTAEADGYVVVRMERAPELVGARIVDMVGSAKAIPLLLHDACVYAARAGAAFVDFFTSWAGDDAALTEAGFVLAPTLADPPPSFLLPVDHKRSDITFASWQQEGGKNPWYVVKADGDKDRAPGKL